MKSRKLAIVIIVPLVFLFGVTFAAWAGGAGGALACCVVDGPGNSIATLVGTATVVYYGYPYLPRPGNIDVKLRLERGSKFGFFELHLDEDIYGLDNYEVACLIFNPNEPKPTSGCPGSPDSTLAVAALVDEILTAFFPKGGLDHTNTSLVITRKSITLTDGSSGAEIGGTGRQAAMGDVVVYVVDKAAARWESNANCVECGR